MVFLVELIKNNNSNKKKLLEIKIIVAKSVFSFFF